MAKNGNAWPETRFLMGRITQREVRAAVSAGTEPSFDPENRAPDRIPPQAIRPTQEAFFATQEWEGVVIEIDAVSGTFVARLTDVTAGENSPSEIGEFEVSDISPDDIDLFRVGGVFRWAVGFGRTRAGSRYRGSKLIFRRRVAWRKRDIREAVDKATSISDGIIWD